MVAFNLAVGAALATIAAATKTCLNQTVPVSIESRNAMFELAVPHSNSDVTTFIQNLTRQGANYTNEALTGYHTVQNTYHISTKFCYDSETAGNSPTLQILTHGIGFDKTYWDLSYNNYNYSYVNAALAAGYVTLSYDRLGIGNSSHGEPLNEIQSFLEIQSLRALTTMLREGQFPNVAKAYPEIVHVGHSFGSVQSYAFANSYPNETQGLVLTGFAMNSSFTGYFAAGGNFQQASLNAPRRFGNASAQPLPDGYIISADMGSSQYQFLLPPFFDPEIGVVAEKTKQPVTLGELLTLGSLPMMNDFDGPVLVITGSGDLPFCGGDCLNTGGTAASIPAQVVKSFPNVAPENFTAYVQPNTGHGINVHYNSTGAYAVINSFLKSKGLSS